MTLHLCLLMISLLTLTVSAASIASGQHHDHGHDGAHRQHGTHVHGIATLNVALEDNEVQLELESPAANVVGFEHAPSSDADHAALDKAVAMLNNGDALFRFNKEAGCRMEKAMIESALLEHEHRGQGDGHGHDDHKHEKHAHDAYAHEHHSGDTHSDIDVNYHFECDKPGSLTRLTVELFEAFPGMQELRVQYVIENKQGGAELTSARHVVNF